MGNDLLLVSGIVLVGFGLVSFVSAFASSNPRRTPVVMVVLGFGMITWAIITTPGGYAFDEIPDVFVRVVAQLVR